MNDEIERDSYPAIYCYLCNRQLRTIDWEELEEIHTHSSGEDVCENCCDICNSEYQDEYGYEDDDNDNPYYDVE